MNAQQILYRTRDKLYRTRLGNRVIILSKASGLYWVFARYFSKKKARLMFSNPTQNMINSRKFYDNNMDRVEEVISWLEDEQSKDCFRKMINFRCTCNVDEFPFCDGNSQYFMHDFIDYSQDEVLIDCGAFVGDGYDKFIKALKHYKANYKKIIAFEPDPDNVSILRKRKIPNINIINYGCI